MPARIVTNFGIDCNDIFIVREDFKEGMCFIAIRHVKRQGDRHDTVLAMGLQGLPFLNRRAGAAMCIIGVH